jgi:hypothetical protein
VKLMRHTIRSHYKELKAQKNSQLLLISSELKLGSSKLSQ